MQTISRYALYNANMFMNNLIISSAVHILRDIFTLNTSKPLFQINVFVYICLWSIQASLFSPVKSWLSFWCGEKQTDWWTSPALCRSLETLTLEMDSGVRTLDIGVQTMDIWVRTLNIGAQRLDIGMRTLDIGVRTLDIWVRTPDIGVRILDIGVRTLDIGVRILVSFLRLVVRRQQHLQLGHPGHFI